MTKVAGKRASSRSYDPVQTRASIIEAGLKLFKRDGFAATAVKDIADEAGVTKGAFYHHFKSKEELLLLIHNDYLEYQHEVIAQAIAQQGTATEKMRMIIAVILEALEKYHENVTIFFQERRYLAGPEFEHARQRRNDLEDLFHGVLQQGMDSGEFRKDLDITVTSLGIIGMCAWTYQWYSPTGKLGTDAIARIFSALAIDGLRVTA